VKRALLLGLAVAWQLTAHAADVIPAHLTGVWGTAESLYAGTTGQSELHLQADGFGVLVGSSASPTLSSGPDKGKPGPRVVMGFPVRATWDGDIVTVAVFMPGEKNIPGPLPCRHEASGATLTCTMPDRGESVMKRRSTTLPVDSVKLLKEMQAWLALEAGKAGGLPQAPSTRP
jgi:hypothetical protein